MGCGWKLTRSCAKGESTSCCCPGDNLLIHVFAEDPQMPTLIGATDEPLLVGTTQAEAPSARRHRSSSLLSSILKSVSVNSCAAIPLTITKAISLGTCTPSTLLHAACALRKTNLASQQVLESLPHTFLEGVQSCMRAHFHSDRRVFGTCQLHLYACKVQRQQSITYSVALPTSHFDMQIQKIAS